MCKYVCAMCVCTHICTYVHMHVCTYVAMFRIYVRTYVRIVCLFRIYVHTYVSHVSSVMLCYVTLRYVMLC